MLLTNRLSGRTLFAEGEEFLFFCGTAYLGIPHHPLFQHHVSEGIQRYGANWGSSRISNLQLDVYEKAEAALAQGVGAAAALTLSSGYLMCQTVIRALEKEGPFIYAPDAHPALWRKESDFFLQKYAQWVAQLPDQIAALPQDHIILVANAVDALRVRQHDFSWIKGLPPHKKFTLLLDDSHGLGITGKGGGGIYSMLEVPAHCTLMVVSSLAKAMGLPGGAVFSDRATIEKLRQCPPFSGSSPILPAYLHAFLQAGQVYEEQREKLLKRIQHFRAAVEPLHAFQTFENYPVFYTPDNRLCGQLKQSGILISSFPYPSPKDAPITRIVLNSQHTEQDIEALVEAIRGAG